MVKSASIPSLVSFPATQFDQFERDIHCANSASLLTQADCVVTTSTTLPKENLVVTNIMSSSNVDYITTTSIPASKDNCVASNTMSSSKVSPSNTLITSLRSHPPPALININVQDICRSNSPVEIDNEAEYASRKRALPHSSTENQDSNKSKKPSSEVSTVLRDSPNNLHDKFKVLYSNSDSPPYIIHVYSITDEASSGPAHPLLISRTLSQLAYADIKEIKRIGRSKVLVEMKSAKAANKLIQDPNLEKEKLKVFIPKYKTIRTSIVRDIPQHFDESDILQYLDAPYRVIEAKRLNRRMRINGEIKYTGWTI